MTTPQVQNDPIYSLPFIYVTGLNVSNNATTPNTKIDIAAGQCRDFNDVMDITLGSSNENLQGNTVTAPLTINASTNGAGGLDTGTFAASKVYAVYMIGDSRYYNPTSAVISLSLTGPTMPFGYDSHRLIGFAVTDSSVHFLKMWVSSGLQGRSNFRQFFFDAPQATSITAGNATSYTAIDLTALVPAIDNLAVNVFSALTPGAAGRGIFLQGANSTGDAVVELGQVTSVVLNSYNWVLSQLVSSVPKINYKVSNSGDAVAIKIAGFNFSV